MLSTQFVRNSGAEALPELKRIIGLIREKWQDTHIAHQRR